MPRPHFNFRLSLSQWMLLFSLLTLLPFIAYAAYVGRDMLESRAAERDRYLSAQAQNASMELQALIARQQALMRMLAVSKPADRSDLAGLSELAMTARAVSADGVEIALLTLDSRLLFSTSGAPGDRAAQVPLPVEVRQALDHGESWLSDIYPTADGSGFEVALCMPLALGGTQLHALRLTLSSEVLGNALKRAAVQNPQMLIGLIDSHGLLMARSVSAAALVGKPVTPSALALARNAGRAGVGNAISREGRQMRVAVLEVSGTPWRLLAGMSAEAQSAELPDHFIEMAGLGLLTIGLSIICSMALGLYLGRQMEQVARFHATRPGDFFSESSGLMVRELHQVASALASAAENERAASALASRAQLDELTGLALRPLFISSAERLAAVATQRRLAMGVLYVDLDGFKALNDSAGHAAGDAALRAVGALIRDCIRGDDVAGRLGGDEFAVVISAPANVISGIAIAISTRLTSRVKAMPEGIGCSIGVKVAEEPPFDIAALLQAADAAMF
ncbi:MAG TPA: sensor domain-containing diguanylate cyclase, partial [Burkholderiaceae bacterium]